MDQKKEKQNYFHELFSLKENTNYGGTIETIRSDIEFRNGNIWALILAILIASVGLNTNSPAVIIGAMLISPLMGPIVGIGFGLGTNDFSLMRRSLRNLLIATVASLIASTVYFSLSPLAEIQSELLARTRPTLYDVLIAFFGGSAGIIAVSRKSPKANILSGVSIATALMPPLCTAGFGLATHNSQFFFGALHLFLINALFICLATLLFTKLMKFHEHAVDPTHLTRTRTVLTVLVIGIAVPSVYTGFVVIKEAQFKEKARTFVDEQVSSMGRVVVKHTLRYSTDSSRIEVTVVGEPISDSVKYEMESELPRYELNRTILMFFQPTFGEKENLTSGVNDISSSLLSSQENRIVQLESELIELKRSQKIASDLSRELSVLFEDMQSISTAREIPVHDSLAVPTGVLNLIWNKEPSPENRLKCESFARLKISDSIRVIHTIAISTPIVQ